MADKQPASRSPAASPAAGPRRVRVAAGDGLLRAGLLDCRRLLSERGAANGPAIALAIVGRIDTLSDEARSRFF